MLATVEMFGDYTGGREWDEIADIHEARVGESFFFISIQVSSKIGISPLYLVSEMEFNRGSTRPTLICLTRSTGSI